MFPALALAAILHRPEVLVCAVVAEAEKVGIDPVIVCSLVEVESEWNPRAKSSRVEFYEESEDMWKCSGCGGGWLFEAENPRESGYKFCPGCGGRITHWRPLPTAPEDR